MIEDKVFELFERVRKLEEKEIVNNRQLAKSIREVEFEVMGTNKEIEKTNKVHSYYKEEVEKLRNELT